MIDPARPQGPTGPEIVARGVCKSFGEQVVLRDVSLEVLRGELVAIVGASGSGKTVLLDILTGLIHPDAGTVEVCDHSRADRPMVDLHALDWQGLDAVRLHWAIVFQRNALFSGSVLDNIALWFREHTPMSEEAIEARTRESLRAVALDPDEVLLKQRETLSGGMAKRVAIARAIAVDPQVVFYDEPTTGLDPVISAHIHDLIHSLHQKPLPDGTRRTSLVVTHDKELLRRLRPRVIMLVRGGIGFDGPYDDFIASADEGAREYLREMPVLNARARR